MQLFWIITYLSIYVFLKQTFYANPINKNGNPINDMDILLEVAVSMTDKLINPIRFLECCSGQWISFSLHIIPLDQASLPPHKKLLMDDK